MTQTFENEFVFLYSTRKTLGEWIANLPKKISVITRTAVYSSFDQTPGLVKSRPNQPERWQTLSNLSLTNPSRAGRHPCQAPAIDNRGVKV